MIATLPLPSADPHPMRRSPEPADPDPNAAAAPSKTQRKRDSHELQHLGEALAALPDEQLARLELPEGLADAHGVEVVVHHGVPGSVAGAAPRSSSCTTPSPPTSSSSRRSS